MCAQRSAGRDALPEAIWQTCSALKKPHQHAGREFAASSGQVSRVARALKAVIDRCDHCMPERSSDTCDGEKWSQQTHRHDNAAVSPCIGGASQPADLSARDLRCDLRAGRGHCGCAVRSQLGMSPEAVPRRGGVHPSRAESAGGGDGRCNCNRDSHPFRLLASGPFLGRLPSYVRRSSHPPRWRAVFTRSAWPGRG